MEHDHSYKVSFITTLHPKRDAGTDTAWCIAKVYNLETGTQLTIKGILPGSYRRSGEEFTIEKATAPFTSPQYPKSPTVEFKACRRDRPIGKHGVVKFLKKAEGIGAAYAERIWNEFGENTIQTIIEQPQDVVDRCGISLDTVTSASRQLRDEYDIHGHMLPVLDLLVRGGISDRFVRPVMGLRLADPIAEISENPFILCKIRGIRFKTADRLRAVLGLPSLSKDRVRAAFLDSIRDLNGHVWVNLSTLLNGVGNLLGCPFEEFTWVLDELIYTGKINYVEENGVKWFADHDEAENENIVANNLLERMALPAEWPVQEIEADAYLKSHHKEVLLYNIGLGGSVLVLAGRPGTGKTMTLSRIIDILVQKGLRVAAVAPTGKAAQRLQSVISVPCTTVHKLLKPAPNGDGWEFTVRPGELQYDVIAVDETSMLDNRIARALLLAAPVHTRFIFVGDRDQLPPVGPGTLMRDIQELGFRELTQIIRNGGGITTACSNIKDNLAPVVECGEVWRASTEVDEWNNLQWIPLMLDPAKRDAIADIISDMKSGVIPYDIKDVQFVTATHSNPHVGRRVLNDILQAEFNPDGCGKHQKFRVGDKVINGKNGMLAKFEGEDKNGNLIRGEQIMVANGEMGTVLISREKTIVVELHIGGEKVVANCSEDGGDWDLGYCITVHKSQGSEWPVVVVLMGNGYGDQQVAGREWLYTAISRGKKVTVLIGHSFQIEATVKKRRIWERKSMMLKYWGVKNETTQTCLDDGDRYQGTTALDVGQHDGGNRKEYPLLVPADGSGDAIAW